MKVLIVENKNTETGNRSDILKKFIIVRSWEEKNKALKLFDWPVCTKDEELLKQAQEYENILMLI